MCWTLQEPARTRNTGRAAVSLVAVAAVGALVCGCSRASSVAPHTEISMNTPPGFRAQQTMDMLNSDWPIGPNGVATLAAPDEVNTVEPTMENLWWERPYTVSGVDYNAGRVKLHLVNSFGAGQDIEIHTDENGMVDLFRKMSDEWTKARIFEGKRRGRFRPQQ